MTDVQKKDQVEKGSTKHDTKIPDVHIPDVKGPTVEEASKEHGTEIPDDHIQKPKPLEA